MCIRDRHRGAQTQGGQAGPGDHIRLGVGNGDAVVHISGALILPGVECLLVGFCLDDVAVAGLPLYQPGEDLVPVGGRGIQLDGLCGCLLYTSVVVISSARPTSEALSPRIWVTRRVM